METYTFKAMDMGGAQSVGEVAAESKQAVSDQLKARGLVVLDISSKSSSREINITLFERVKAKDLSIMSRQLATMVSSGMSLLRTLFVLEEQTESKLLKEALAEVRKDIEAGSSLSQAMVKHPKVFNELYVAMVDAGEQGGVLEDSLRRVADQLEADDSLRRKVRSAMVYPAVVVSFALIVLIALITFLVPVFAKIFEEFDSELPAITQFCLFLSSLFTDHWYFVVGGVALAVWAFRYWKNSERGRPQWDTVRLKFPFKIGDVMHKVALARWSRTLSSLISSGVPIMQAIDITGRTAGNKRIEFLMEDVIASVRSGGTIEHPLRGQWLYPAMVTQMIGVGEETGALDEMLGKIADFYDDEVESAIKALTSILEPVMIIVVGAIVGFVVIAMYMPMFKVYDAIR